MVLPCQVARKSMSLSWWTGSPIDATMLGSQEVNISVMVDGSPIGATMLGSQEVNISVMVDGELHWCQHARFLGSQYRHHGGQGAPLALPFQGHRKSIYLSCRTGNSSDAPMLGSYVVNIAIIVDGEYRWCYHATFLGSQYLLHGGRGVPMVLPCQVPRKSRSQSWWTGSPCGATMLGCQEVNVSIMVDGEPHWWYHARFLGSQYLHHGGRGVTFVLLYQVAMKSMSLSWLTGSPIGGTMLDSQEVNISIMVDGEPHWCYHARVIGSQ